MNRPSDIEIIASLQRQRKELKAELRICYELIEAYEKLLEDYRMSKNYP